MCEIQENRASEQRNHTVSRKHVNIWSDLQNKVKITLMAFMLYNVAANTI
jgi:hypothetical protein